MYAMVFLLVLMSQASGQKLEPGPLEIFVDYKVIPFCHEVEGLISQGAQGCWECIADNRAGNVVTLCSMVEGESNGQ